MIRRLIALALSLVVRAWDLAIGRARRVLGRSAPPLGVVLYYHAVKPYQRAGFARQMDMLIDRAKPFAAGLPETISAGVTNVAVTFDDGFQSVVDNALPELSKRSIPFTMFVPTGCLGERPSWVHDPSHPSWEEQVLSADELRALAGMPLVTLGSHTVTHPNLLSLDAASVDRELTQSRSDLGRASAKSVDLFSFPHGAHDAALAERARAAGYTKLFTVEPTLVHPQGLLIGRVAAEPDDWPLEFRLKIAGAYRWRHLLHRLRRVA